MKAVDVKKFKQMLLDRRVLLAGDVRSMEDHALRTSRQDASGDLSNMPIHMADIGSDNYEQEFTLDLIQNEESEVRQIDEALERIDDGTFGVCSGCSKVIPKTRLKVIPYTTMCIECKKEAELAAGGE